MFSTFTFILLSIISLLILVNYFSNIFANEGFKSSKYYLLSFVLSSIMIILDLVFVCVLFKDNIYYLSFMLLFLYHLLSFWIIYSTLNVLMYVLEGLDIAFIRYVNLF